VPEYVIKTQFRGADKLSPLLKRLGINVKRTGDQASRSFRRASKQGKIFGGVLKGILAAGVIQRGLGLAQMAVRGLAEEFVDFDINITKAVTRLPGELDRSSQAFADFSRAARVEAAKTEFTAGETAKAVEQLALAGFGATQVMGALPGVLQLATNAQIDVDTATRMATKSLGAFGLRTQDTAQLQVNLTRINDVFSRAVSSAALNIEDMFEALKYAGPSMRAAGQSVETFGATVELLADRSIDASIAGTNLRRAFINMAAPSPKAAKQLKRLDVVIQDSSGNFRDFVDILADIEKGVEGMGNVQRSAALSTIFGARAVNSINALLDAGSDTLRKYRGRLEEAGGASKKMAETIRTSLGVRLKILRSVLIELGFKFVTAFTGKAGKGLDDLTKKIRKFDVKPIVQGVKDAARWISNLWKAIKPIRDNMGTIVELFLAYKAALIAVTAVQAVVFYLKLGAAIRAAAKAQGVLNLTMAANPIGLVILAVAVLAFGIYKLIQNWDTMRDHMELFIRNAFIGFRFLELKIMQGIENAINFVANKLNWLIEKINLIPGINIPLISPRDYTSDLKRELKTLIQERDKLVKEIEAPPVARGAAGIGGARGTARQRILAREARVQAAAQQAARQRLGLAGLATGGVIGLAGVPSPTIVPGLEVGELGGGAGGPAGGEFRFIFENIPPGLKLKERKTTGSTDIALEGLGPQ